MSAALSALLGAGAGAAGGCALGPYARREGSRLPRAVLVLLCAAACAAAAAGAGWSRHLPLAAATAGALCLAAAIDLHAYRIPNRLVAALAAAALVAQVLPGFAPAPVLPTLLGAAALALPFGLAALLSRGGVGWGDAKLSAALGLALGPRGAVLALVATALAAGLGGAAALAARRRGLRDPLPLAPFFLAGGLAALLLR